jgi:hypothetical protein
MKDQLLSAAVFAMQAIARLDVAEHGYAAVRARFIRAGAIEPLELNARAMLILGIEGVPEHQRPDAAAQHFVAQLTGGRLRAAAMLEALGPRELPTGAIMLLAYMDTLPAAMQGSACTVGCWIEAWKPRDPGCILRGVMPMTARDSVNRLQEFRPVVGKIETQRPRGAALN